MVIDVGQLTSSLTQAFNALVTLLIYVIMISILLKLITRIVEAVEVTASPGGMVHFITPREVRRARARFWEAVRAYLPEAYEELRRHYR